MSEGDAARVNYLCAYVEGGARDSLRPTGAVRSLYLKEQVTMPSAAQVRRARILAAFVRRGIMAARAQRRRLAEQERHQAEGPADYDLDFYAHAAWQVREAGRLAVHRLGRSALVPVLKEFDEAVPGLRDYRDMVAHALDDRVDAPAWFGTFAVELLERGRVRYLIDSRHHHEALERFAQRVLDALSEYVGEDLHRLH